MLRALAALVLIAVAPAWASATGSDGRLTVVTTTTDLKSIVEVVGGDRVVVESLAPPLHDPHTVEVKPGQLARLKHADLLVRIGLDHEPWLARALRAVGNPKLRYGSAGDLDVAPSVALLETETPRVRSERGVHVHGFGNTHYWLDPDNGKAIAAAIAIALAKIAPADAAVFEENRTRFVARLDDGLVRWTRAMAPYRGTRVVVAHETWPYFARRFGLVIVTAIEPTPGVPASPAWIERLTRGMRESGVKILISEPYADAAVVRQVAARSGATIVTLAPSVGADAAITDYVSLFDVNVKRLTTALATAR